jgi:hypothetical protein
MHGGPDPGLADNGLSDDEQQMIDDIDDSLDDLPDVAITCSGSCTGYTDTCVSLNGICQCLSQSGRFTGHAC